MIITQENCNEFLNKYILFTEEISTYYHYEKNIKHLLYLIIPAFVAKYGLENESTILKCFREIKIYINPHEDKTRTAYFARIPHKEIKEGKERFYTEKYIMLNDYQTATLPHLFDNLIHEFNHAVNSINNEIYYDDKTLAIRTGLTFLYYDKDTLKIKRKSEDTILEEIINTVQTEEIIDIINSFNHYSITNDEFKNALYSLNLEINGKYESQAYYLQTYICKELIKNKTFISTITNLRLKGIVEDIPTWFDNIVGQEKTYEKMCKLLNEIFKLEEEYANSKWWKQRKLNKIKIDMKEVLEIITNFSNQCIFK